MLAQDERLVKEAQAKLAADQAEQARNNKGE